MPVTSPPARPTARPPLAPGSVSLRVYPVSDEPRAAIAGARAQAIMAEAVGFDGCMVSEHHGGFPNYFPNPIQVASWLLESTERIWCAPCPLVLPLRPTSQVIEDAAWAALRYGGRFGLGLAAGALPVDFDLAGVPFGERNARFRAALAEVVAHLAPQRRGERQPRGSPLDGDPAVGARPEVPMVVAAQSRAAAERAARLGVGVLFDSLQSPSWLAELASVYRAAGGAGPVVGIRRVAIGPEPRQHMERQRQRYLGYAPDAARAHWDPDDGLLAGEHPGELADRLVAFAAQTGCDSVDLRVFLAGMTIGEVLDQVEHLGEGVLGPLRSAWARTAAPAGPDDGAAT